MLKVFASPSRYVQGRDAIYQLPEELDRLALSDPFFIIASPSARRLLDTVWADVFARRGSSFEVAEFSGECCEEEIQRLTLWVKAHGLKTVIGAGGGKVLDTARAVAFEAARPVVCCPTTAASDAPCSALSVVYSSSGVFERYLFYRRNPDLVLVDTAVIAKAPVRLLVAGMGDALATRFEAEASRTAFRSNQVGGLSTLAAAALADLCYRTLLEDGEAAVLSAQVGAVTPAFERIVEANTLLSGLGFESGGLALAHSVQNGLTVLASTHDRLHGEKVAFGTLVQLVLEGREKNCLDEVISFCVRVGLPVTFKQLGVDHLSDEAARNVAHRVLAVGETSHNEPFAMQPSDVAEALRVADAMGARALAIS